MRASDARLAALELNDAGLAVIAEDGAFVASASPGYALFDGNELMTGSAAWRRARVSPRRVESRFWEELAADAPLPRPFPRGLTRADLAYRHLGDLRREVPGPARVIVAAGGGYGEAELAILLGVAAASGWEIVGLVDGALAAATTGPVAAAALHLDLELHRAVLSELAESGESGDDVVERRGVRIDGGLGWTRFESAWARFFAAAFVRATRFDPLHTADSEQRLFLEMESWLERLAGGERVELTLSTARGEQRAEVSQEETVAAVEGLYEGLAALVNAVPKTERSVLLLSHRLGRLPGLSAHLATVCGVDVRSLQPAAAGVGALAARDWIVGDLDGDAPRFVLRLPRRSDGAA